MGRNRRGGYLHALRRTKTGIVPIRLDVAPAMGGKGYPPREGRVVFR